MTATTDPWAEPETAPEAEKAPEPAKPEAKEAPKPAEEASPAPAKKATAAKAAAPAAAAKKTTAAPKAAAPTEHVALGATLADMAVYVTSLYWGPEGTGKTTAALRMVTLHDTKRVILIDAEAGAKVRALKQRGVDVSRIEVWPRPEDGGPGAVTFEGLYDLADQLALHADEYIGWVWDSGTEITKRILDQVTSEARAKDERLGKARGRFQINLEDHGVASAMLRELLRKFRDLPMHGAITALERRDQDEDTGRVKYGPAMAPAMANDAAGLVDVVIDCVTDQLGDHVIRSGVTVPTKIRRAKDRFGVLPAKMADPYFDRVVGYVTGDLTPENDPVRARVLEIAASVNKPAAPAAEPEKKEGD